MDELYAVALGNAWFRPEFGDDARARVIAAVAVAVERAVATDRRAPPRLPAWCELLLVTYPGTMAAIAAARAPPPPALRAVRRRIARSAADSPLLRLCGLAAPDHEPGEHRLLDAALQELLFTGAEGRTQAVAVQANRRVFESSDLSSHQSFSRRQQRGRALCRRWATATIGFIRSFATVVAFVVQRQAAVRAN